MSYIPLTELVRVSVSPSFMCRDKRHCGASGHKLKQGSNTSKQDTQRQRHNRRPALRTHARPLQPQGKKSPSYTIPEKNSAPDEELLVVPPNGSPSQGSRRKHWTLIFKHYLSLPVRSQSERDYPTSHVILAGIHTLIFERLIIKKREKEGVKNPHSLASIKNQQRSQVSEARVGGASGEQRCSQRQGSLSSACPHPEPGPRTLLHATTRGP